MSSAAKNNGARPVSLLWFKNCCNKGFFLPCVPFETCLPQRACRGSVFLPVIFSFFFVFLVNASAVQITNLAFQSGKMKLFPPVFQKFKCVYLLVLVSFLWFGSLKRHI